MSVLNDLIVWVLLWVITFGLLYFLSKRGVSYNKRYGWLILLFLFFTLLAGLYFEDTLVKIDGKFTLVPILILVFVYGFTILVYFTSQRYLQRPSGLIKKYSNQHFIKMDYRYLISKSFDILFQQVMIVAMILKLSEQNYSLNEIILYFSIFFGLVHIFALFPAGKIFGTYYLVSSLIGAVIFPILILKVNYGFIYSYIVHFFFYSISSVFFWIFAKKFSSIETK